MATRRLISHTLFGFAFLFSSCGREEPPRGVIDIPTFAQAYVALVENREILQRWDTFNVKRFEADTTLARFGVTRDQIAVTIGYYNTNPDRWQEFYREVVRLLERKK